MLLLDPLHVAVSVCYTFIVAVWTKISILDVIGLKRTGWNFIMKLQPSIEHRSMNVKETYEVYQCRS